MILNNAPAAEAVMSNVGAVGEFRIKNSAKAFSILSSGLYGNKIKAVIRELSCNATDSHTAAGNADPFEVHLPTALEPWFSVRDFGTGLDHDQVTNIYTTYFESTKTASNAFIGALGLGSKSPFSYTDNFSVTAIKDGRKGVYTAFINDEGVPSIALMCEEQTIEYPGVEVKFSVNNDNDFYKFYEEAQKVYRWFKLKPTIFGVTNFDVKDIVYDSVDIIPGVHSFVNTGYRSSVGAVAIMGNIAYPIEVPQRETTLEGLHHLLSCNLILHFGIGELDFQASREGLSYIPSTINSIRDKLKQVSAALVGVITKEANNIDNQWERSFFLHSKKSNALWKSAVQEYVLATDFKFYDVRAQWNSSHSLEVKTSVTDPMNIVIKGFTFESSGSCPNIKPSRWPNPNSNTVDSYFDIPVKDDTAFIENDTKTGAIERAKFSFRNNEKRVYRRHIYVLSAIDKKKPMDLVAFYALIGNPPENQRKLVSSLDSKVRASSHGINKNVAIIKLQERGGPSYRVSSKKMVWREAGTVDSFDKNETYYYLPMTGFKPQFENVRLSQSIFDLQAMMAKTTLPELRVVIHGVRKADIETIKGLKNWVNLEHHVVNVLNAKNVANCWNRVHTEVDRSFSTDYNLDKLLNGISNDKSPAKMFLDMAIIHSKNPVFDVWSFSYLMKTFCIADAFDISEKVKEYKILLEKFVSRYPLVYKLNGFAVEDDVSDYVNLIDQVKGI